MFSEAFPSWPGRAVFSKPESLPSSDPSPQLEAITHHASGRAKADLGGDQRRMNPTALVSDQLSLSFLSGSIASRRPEGHGSQEKSGSYRLPLPPLDVPVPT